MSARILVVDDVDVNVRLLEAKLTIEYYDVLTCNDGATALYPSGCSSLVQRMQSLVAEVNVDLDAPLSEDDE
jgi:CheY-like chemotaxis protein